MLLIPLLLLLLTTTATIIVATTTIGPSSLRLRFYSETCPEAEATVRTVIKDAMIREPRSGASVMRLQFHDCFVNAITKIPLCYWTTYFEFHLHFNLIPVCYNYVTSKLRLMCVGTAVLFVSRVFYDGVLLLGCDASVLLDETPDMLGEKLGLSNINSLRSFEVIDEAKEALERVCPQTVPCADLVIMAARDAVVLSGGPDWDMKLGRKDSLMASQEDSDNIMPSPRANASYLVDLFHRFNLSVKDLVALSGSHSIGEGRCFSIVFRLYNQSGSGKPDPEMDPTYREKLDRLCPTTGDQNVTGGLDMTPTLFDNQYFQDLVLKKGFLNSDQTLHTFEQTRAWVEKFSEDQGAFFEAFVEGMVKMGDLQSGRPGEIRRNCRVVNKPQIAHWDFLEWWVLMVNFI